MRLGSLIVLPSLKRHQMPERSSKFAAHLVKHLFSLP
jgi:hypothetical protein